MEVSRYAGRRPPPVLRRRAWGRGSPEAVIRGTCFAPELSGPKRTFRGRHSRGQRRSTLKVRQLQTSACRHKPTVRLLPRERRQGQISDADRTRRTTPNRLSDSLLSGKRAGRAGRGKRELYLRGLRGYLYDNRR